MKPPFLGNAIAPKWGLSCAIGGIVSIKAYDVCYYRFDSNWVLPMLLLDCMLFGESIMARKEASGFRFARRLIPVSFINPWLSGQEESPGSKKRS
ncbi:unnamed protein product [Absidia cylindrospora]